MVSESSLLPINKINEVLFGLLCFCDAILPQEFAKITFSLPFKNLSFLSKLAFVAAAAVTGRFGPSRIRKPSDITLGFAAEAARNGR